MRKFSKLLTEVFQEDVAKQLKQEDAMAEKTLGKVWKEGTQNTMASAKDRTTLAEDLSKGEGSKMTSDMNKQKEAFIKKHAIKKSTQEAMDKVELSQNQTVVSLPRKRASGSDSDDIEVLEKKLRKEGSNKKRFKHK